MTCIRSTPVLALLLAAGVVGHADAALSVSAAIGGAPSGVIRDNLDSLSLTPGSGPVSQLSATGITINLDGNARVVNGSVGGQFAAPYLSGSNGTGFGNAPGPGADTTNYLSSGSTGAVGAASIEFVLPLLATGYTYFGLLWGSIDGYNTLSFFNGATLIGSVTGSQAAAAAGTLPNGNQAGNGTAYVNITSDAAFTRVVATSSQYAFELDNVAYNQAVPVPEPATMALLGAGLVGLGIGLVRRRRRG